MQYNKSSGKNEQRKIVTVKGNIKWCAKGKSTIGKTQLFRNRTHIMMPHTIIYIESMNREINERLYIKMCWELQCAQEWMHT